VLRHEPDPEAISDRVVTKRLVSGETAAFVRLRVDNRGCSTARNVAVRVLKVHRWTPVTGEWVRSRPELDGRLLQPSNHLAGEPDLVDVFPYSDRIVDLASVDLARACDGAKAMYVEISHPWPPNGRTSSNRDLATRAPGLWRQHQGRAVVRHGLVRWDVAAGRSGHRLGALCRPRAVPQPDDQRRSRHSPG
jgi:hypothetical protein